MSIISVSYLKAELPNDANNLNKLLTKSVNRASSYINTWTSKRHYPFSDYDTTTGEPTAPDEIVFYCTEVAKAFYFSSIGEVSRSGEERSFWLSHLNEIKKDLQELKVSPEWLSDTISLDSNNVMSLGGSASNHGVFNIIPHNAEITGGTSQWVRNDDWKIVKGEFLNQAYIGDYITDSWYLYSTVSDSLDGTIHYMRTFRKDGGDYAIYSRTGA